MQLPKRLANKKEPGDASSVCYGLRWWEGKSAGSFITFPVLNQFPFLLIRFPLEDVVSVELEFFDAFPDVIKCSERELRRVSKCLGTSPAMPRS